MLLMRALRALAVFLPQVLNIKTDLQLLLEFCHTLYVHVPRENALFFLFQKLAGLINVSAAGRAATIRLHSHSFKLFDHQRSILEGLSDSR